VSELIFKAESLGKGVALRVDVLHKFAPAVEALLADVAFEGRLAFLLLVWLAFARLLRYRLRWLLRDLLFRLLLIGLRMSWLLSFFVFLILFATKVIVKVEVFFFDFKWIFF
jgi:hypothetical protein